MKTCPVCRAEAFDDAAVCYGCMHRFESDPAPRHGASAKAADACAPSFLIRMVPSVDGSGLTAWACSVDVVGA